MFRFWIKKRVRVMAVRGLRVPPTAGMFNSQGAVG